MNACVSAWLLCNPTTVVIVIVIAIVDAPVVFAVAVCTMPSSVGGGQRYLIPSTNATKGDQRRWLRSEVPSPEEITCRSRTNKLDGLDPSLIPRNTYAHRHTHTHTPQ